MTAAVAAKDLTFAYRPDRPVLRLPALEIGRAEQVFLYGPSGSGKTTLLGLLAGILSVQGGSLQVLGRDLASLPGSARDRLRGDCLGYIFQLFNLIPYLSVADNIALPCRLSASRRRRLGGDLTAAVKALAQRLGIAELLHRLVHELSVGQQQRVAAARALLGGPELIIADEPTSALDTEHRQDFLRLLFDEAARSKAAVLFVSHDLALAPLFQRQLSLPDLNSIPLASAAHARL